MRVEEQARLRCVRGSACMGVDWGCAWKVEGVRETARGEQNEWRRMRGNERGCGWNQEDKPGIRREELETGNEGDFIRKWWRDWYGEGPPGRSLDWRWSRNSVYRVGNGEGVV